MFNFRLYFFIVCCFPGISISAEIIADDGLEKKIVHYVQLNETTAINLLEKVVNINSGTMNFAGIRKTANILSKQLSDLGFDTTWIPAKAFNRAGHLVANYGHQGPKLLLIGHLDTVFSKESRFQKFKKIDDQYITGPGITDMKGGNVVMLSALKALKQAGVLDALQIKIILMGDEEKRGRPVLEASSILLNAGVWADVALGFEDGDGNPKTAVISRRGSTSWQLTVTAKPAHSSQIFQKDIGFGAIFETARILQGFMNSLSSYREDALTFNPGVMVAGTRAELDNSKATGNAYGKNNVIPQISRVSGDLRAVSPEQLKKAKKLMSSVVAKSFEGTHSSIKFDDGYPPMAATPGNKRLLTLYSQISQKLGYGEVVAVNPRNAGAADISFVASDVDMALDGLGLMGVKGHTIDETADMNTFIQQTARVAILMYHLQLLYD